MSRQEELVSQDWLLYQKGIDYKTQINLFQEVNKNERFYAGRQWDGVVANGLPTPVLNICKRIIDYKVSTIMSNQLKIQYTIDGEYDEEQQAVVDALTAYAAQQWERLKMDSINEQVLLDAAISGDGVAYFFWDPDIRPPDPDAEGDINVERIDNVNIFFGNPNDPRVETQPYILITFRKMVEDVQREAKQNGMPVDVIKNIVPDDDKDYQSGDRSKIELDDAGKVTCILKLWKKDGRVYFRKSTKQVVYKKDTDAELTRYPVAFMNWSPRKNSCHGTPECTQIIPNQIYINKMAAMIMLSQMHTAFPKLLYNQQYISAPSNQIGEAIPVQNTPMDVRNVAMYLNPGSISADVYGFLDAIIAYTKEMQGANETALGEVKPENTSAIIAIQQASAIPLESIKRRFYQYIEDIALIWLDFWLNKYNRNIVYEQDGEQQALLFNGEQYRNLPFRVKIDVGPSTQWSEITAIQTLDNLLKDGHIDFIEYLERLPNGLLPKKQELIDKRQEMQQMMEQGMMNQSMTQGNPEIDAFIQSLPPEIQQTVAQLTPEEIMGMMQLPPEQLQTVIDQLMTQPA